MEIASHFVTDEDLKNNFYYTNKTYYTVPVIRISEYINTYVATRKIPPGKKGAVVMKLDVEVNKSHEIIKSAPAQIPCSSLFNDPQGMEVGIMGDLIMSGALAHLDNIHVDWPMYRLSEKDFNKGEGVTVDLKIDEKIGRFK